MSKPIGFLVTSLAVGFVCALFLFGLASERCYRLKSALDQAIKDRDNARQVLEEVRWQRDELADTITRGYRIRN